MNKTNLIDIVAEKADLKKKDAEEGGKIQIAGFGSFKVKERSARVGRNPKTLEQINIPASKSPVFVPGKNLKDAVNG